MSIGSRIRSERKSQNLTMKKLSEMADISISYLGDIEKDRSRPSIERLKDIAKALDRSIAYFIDEDNLGEDESVYLSVDEETKELLTSLLPDEGFLDILREFRGFECWSKQEKRSFWDFSGQRTSFGKGQKAQSRIKSEPYCTEVAPLNGKMPEGLIYISLSGVFYDTFFSL